MAFMKIAVPAEGLEPTRSFDHWILSPARLPVPPRRRQASSSYEAGVIPQAFRRDRPALRQRQLIVSISWVAQLLLPSSSSQSIDGSLKGLPANGGFGERLQTSWRSENFAKNDCVGRPAGGQRNVAISVAVRTTRVFGLASVTSGTSDSLMSSSGAMRAR